MTNQTRQAAIAYAQERSDATGKPFAVVPERGVGFKVKPWDRVQADDAVLVRTNPSRPDNVIPMDPGDRWQRGSGRDGS